MQPSLTSVAGLWRVTRCVSPRGPDRHALASTASCLVMFAQLESLTLLTLMPMGRLAAGDDASTAADGDSCRNPSGARDAGSRAPVTSAVRR